METPHVLVDVHGLVSTRVGNARKPVPHGRYELVERSLGDFELHGTSGVFELTLHDVLSYLRNEMTVVEGQWP